MTQRLLTILSRTEVWVGGLALAAFLVLFWALRGAPLGQATREEDEASDAPGSGYRDRVVAAMVGGLLLVLAGAYLALSGRLAWSVPTFALGFGIVLTLIAVNRRHRHGSPTLRRTIEISNLALSAALVAGILIVANVLAFRFGGRAIDFTREGTFSLSSLTRNQLRTLKRPVAFTLVFGDSARALRQLDRIQQMLELYKAENPGLVSIAYLNPYREVDKYEALLKRHPDVGVTQGGSILIEYGDGPNAEHVVIRNSDLFDVVRNDFQQNNLEFESSFRGEDAVTTALSRLREGKRPKIALITGHGEPSTSEIDPRKAGLGVFKSRLSALGSDVVEVNLLRDKVPDEAALVAIIGPKAPFNADEVAKLKAALDAGKPALAVVGGPEAAGESTGLEDLFRSFNIAVDSTVIVDPLLNFKGQPAVIYAPIMGMIRSPIVDSLANRAVLMPRSSPITIFTSASAPGANGVFNAKVLPVPILRTSEESWGESDLTGKKLDRGEKDAPGPLTVGVAVTDRPDPKGGKGQDKEPRPRLVLFSSRYLADNLFLEVEPTNLDLLMNAINWLRGQAEVGGIAPRTHTSLTLAADPVLRARLILVPTVMAALLIIGFGLTTYMARRE
jgi:hypothetical protein